MAPSLFDFEKPLDHYAVMGNPIAHSKSPKIHSLFAKQTEQHMRYEAIQVDDGGFRQAVGNFLANGGKGLNITVPFKQQAWDFVDALSDRARLAQAVNTIVPKGDTIFGDNTDGIGLVRDLTDNLGITLKNKSVLIIGAGGAARGIIPSLVDAAIASMHVANRSVDRALDLRDHFSSVFEFSASGFDELPDTAFDVIINASASSLHGEMPAIPGSTLKPDSCCYDLMYSAEPTRFMQWARTQGIESCYDGLGMLVEQAAESFYLWRGVRPQTVPVIETLKAEL